MVTIRHRSPPSPTTMVMVLAHSLPTGRLSDFSRINEILNLCKGFLFNSRHNAQVYRKLTRDFLRAPFRPSSPLQTTPQRASLGLLPALCPACPGQAWVLIPPSTKLASQGLQAPVPLSVLSLTPQGSITIHTNLLHYPVELRKITFHLSYFLVYRLFPQG